MAEKATIINIINFVRGVEPRGPVDLYEPVARQLALLSKYQMTGTFLLQYDALLDERFVDLLRDAPHELGCWLEIMQPLTEAAGIPWRGRFPWDWHSDVGFTVGYTPKEREKLVDCYMALFHKTFGRYPKSVGSWMLDAHTLDYLDRRFRVAASCNCKDQWGTDGYTLWGGYYGQAYYPSRTNAYAPAVDAENQINIPVFKMLGSDPIYQYDAGLSVDGAADWQGVVTLEPVYTDGGGGGNPKWVRWFFGEVLHSPCLTFRYAQVGQENSFGWPAMAAGLEDQFAQLDKLSREGHVRIETLEASGHWYKKQYPQTPASAITALTDWKGEGRQSVWFCSKQYRVNFFAEHGLLWIRDLHLYDDGYRERYLSDTCKSPLMVYDNLPLADGNRWSGGGVRAGWYICAGETPIQLEDIAVEEGDGALRIHIRAKEGQLRAVCRERQIRWETDIEGFNLHMRYHKSDEMDAARIAEKKMDLTHAGYAYSLRLGAGRFEGRRIFAEEGEIILSMA